MLATSTITETTTATATGITSKHPDRHGGGRQRHRLAPARRDFAWQVRDERLELTIGPRGERGCEPVLELLGQQTALGGGLPQALDDVLAICIRCSEGRSSGHANRRLARRGVAHKRSGLMFGAHAAPRDPSASARSRIGSTIAVHPPIG